MRILPTLRPAAPVIACVLLDCALAAVALGAGGRIEGRVLNGTTSRPVPGQFVQLLVPGNGLQQVATAKTDASGRFTLTRDESEASPVAFVQAVYQEVNYRARVPFESGQAATVDMIVYDATRTPPPVRIQSARILVRAEGQRVRVQELFAIENSGRPARTYVNPDGTFRFRLGQGAGDPAAAVIGQMNMPLPLAVQDGTAPGEFFVNRALEPGRTVIMVTYEADYSSSQFALHDQVDFPIEQVELYVAPRMLSVESALFRPAGIDSETGSQKLEAENLPADARLEARLRGEAAPSAEAESPQGESPVTTTPSSMTKLGVPLLACFLLVLLWALGVRVAKEWPRWKERRPASPAQKQLEAKAEALLNSLADLDELFAAGKIADKSYWKERLELKARLVAILKKSPPTLLESYATRRTSR